MKIAFDYQTFALQSYGGISRYIVRLAQELAALGEDTHIVAPIHKSRYLKELAPEKVHGLEVERFPPKTTKAILLANRFISSKLLDWLQPDLIHETYYTSKPSSCLSKGRIVTVHDMIHEKFRDQFPFEDQTSGNKLSSITRADHIICISNSTKTDLCEIFNVPPEKISVVYHGFDNFTSATYVPPKKQKIRPFLLYVGNRSGYKNFTRLLQAVASQRNLMSYFDLVAFGGGPFNTSETDLITFLGFPNGTVKQMSGNDEVLGRLYQSASALVYPSLYEGFGLPPLEAMAHGCPVVSSNTSSMPEVIGDAGQYFNPEEIDSQAAAIEQVVFDESRRTSLIEKGRSRLSDFSWKKCALETRDVYRKVILQREIT